MPEVFRVEAATGLENLKGPLRGPKLRDLGRSYLAQAEARSHLKAQLASSGRPEVKLLSAAESRRAGWVKLNAPSGLLGVPTLNRIGTPARMTWEEDLSSDTSTGKSFCS